MKYPKLDKSPNIFFSLQLLCHLRMVVNFLGHLIRLDVHHAIRRERLYGGCGDRILFCRAVNKCSKVAFGLPNASVFSVKPEAHDLYIHSRRLA